MDFSSVFSYDGEMDINSSQFLPLLKKYQENPYSKIFAPLADVYRKQGKIEDAIFLLNQGIKRHPNYDSAKVLLAYCIHEMGNYEEALKILRSVEMDNPLNIKLYKIMGSCLLKLGDFDAAYLVYVKLQFLCPYDNNITKIVQKLSIKNYQNYYQTRSFSEVKNDTLGQAESQKTEAEHSKNEQFRNSDTNRSIKAEPGSSDLKSGHFKVADHKVKKVQLPPPPGSTNPGNLFSASGTSLANEVPFNDNKILSEASSESSGVFSTETKADLLLKQGYWDEALIIYQNLLLQNNSQNSNSILSEKINGVLRLKEMHQNKNAEASTVGNLGIEANPSNFNSEEQRNQQKIAMLKDLLNRFQGSLNTSSKPPHSDFEL